MVTNYIKKFENYTYDDYKTPDLFMSNKLVGRSFKSEKEANEYLVSVLKYDSKNRDISEFNILKDKYGDYIIRPIISEVDKNRKLAGEYIEKYGLSTGVYPLYSFISISQLDDIKDLGIKYRVLPSEKANFKFVLSNIVEDFKHEKASFFSVSGNSIIWYMEEGTYDEVMNILDMLENKLESIKNTVGILSYTIDRDNISAKYSDSYLRSSALFKLGELDKRPKKKYSKIGVELIKEYDGEFVVQIPMMDRSHPEMIGD